MTAIDLQILDPLGDNNTEFGKVRADCIHRHVLLSDKQLTRPMKHQRALLLHRFHWHEAHGRSRHCLADCFSIGCVFLVTLDVWLDILRWQQTHIMTERYDFPSPMVRGRAGLDADRQAFIAREGRTQLQGRRIGILPGDDVMPGGDTGVNPSYREPSQDQELAQMQAVQAQADAEAERQARAGAESQGGRQRQPVPRQMTAGPAPREVGIVMPPQRPEIVNSETAFPSDGMSPRLRQTRGTPVDPRSVQMPDGQPVQAQPDPLAQMHPSFRGQPVEPGMQAPMGASERDMQQTAAAYRAVPGAIAAIPGRINDAVSAEDTRMTQPEREARARLMAQAQTTGQPLQGVVMPPGPAQAPSAPGTAQAAPGGPAPGRQPAQAGQRGQVPTTEDGTPMTSAATVRQAGVSIAQDTSNGRRPTDRQIDRAVDGAVRDYRSNRHRPIVEHFIRTGRPEQARAYEAWMGEREVQEGMRSFVRAGVMLQLGDDVGFMDAMADLYNNRGYYDDGLGVVRDQSSLTNDPERPGFLRGAITFRDNATGRTFVQEFNQPRDLVMAGLMGAVAPETVFQRAWEMTMAPPQQERQLSANERLAIRRQASQEAGIGADDDEIDAAEARLTQRIMGGAASGIGAAQVPVYAN